MADLSDMASLPLNKDSPIGYDVGHFPEDFLYLLTKNSYVRGPVLFKGQLYNSRERVKRNWYLLSS